MQFKILNNLGLELLETPIWDERIGCIYLTDLFSGDVHIFDPKENWEITYQTGKMIGSAIPTTNVDIVLCALEDGLYFLNRRNHNLKQFVEIEKNDDSTRLNDARVDAVGRIFTSSVSKKYGTSDYCPHMVGNFYMIEPNGKVKIIEEGINQYNAIVWNKDNTKMFVVDTYHECIREYAYDLTKGIIGEGRAVINLKEQGMPDGMSIDENDNLYICHWTKKISVWSKELELLKVIETPVEYACCTGFGGTDMKDLYLATSKYCYTEKELSENVGAGGLFIAKTDIPGRPDNFFPIEKLENK